MRGASVNPSREEILAALRRAAPELPGEDEVRIDGVRFPDPARRFAEALEEAGGRCIAVPEASGPTTALRALPVFAEAKRVLSGITGLVPPSQQGGDGLADLDLVILQGSPAVAESGAVWVVPADARQRAAAFLAQHLVLVVPRHTLVHELHQAYEQIDPAAAPYGCFIAGPSKTADIEQALVIGAHGPRSLTVLLHGTASPTAPTSR